MKDLDKRKANAVWIGKFLEAKYPETPIPLDHSDPFTLLIAVLLSAQCTDNRVNKVTPVLFAKANTPTRMAALDPAEVEKIIKSCGLAPRKSKAIVELSQILIDKYEARVPDNFDSLESLPGVGHKTASVVMSQAFGVPAFPVDTHIFRLAKRWKLSDGNTVSRVERDLKLLWPKEEWNSLHLRIIYFGREYCTARAHDEKKCPICSKIVP